MCWHSDTSDEVARSDRLSGCLDNRLSDRLAGVVELVEVTRSLLVWQASPYVSVCVEAVECCI